MLSPHGLLRSLAALGAASALALLAACSDSRGGVPTGDGDAALDASSDARADGDSGATTIDGGHGGNDGAVETCHYPPTNNPPGCPPYYQHLIDAPCPKSGLVCTYPGQGDGASGCDGGATAMMWCAVDGGPLIWTVAN